MKQSETEGDLLSNCCASDFDAFGYEKEEGIWQERCNNCGKLCEPIWIYNNDIKNIHNCVKWNATPIEEKEECKACQHELICDDPQCSRKCPYHSKPKKIEPIKTYKHCRHPEYPTDVIVDKINEIIDVLNGRGDEP